MRGIGAGRVGRNRHSQAHLAMAVIDGRCGLVAIRDLPNTDAGFDSVEALLAAPRVMKVGIEGAGNYGRGVALRMVLRGGVEPCWPAPISLDARIGVHGRGCTLPRVAIGAIMC